MRLVSSTDYQNMLERLRQARLEADLTQEAVARRLGLRQALISKIELGERRIDPIELVRFAAVYDKPVIWFLPARGQDGSRPARRR